MGFARLVGPSLGKSLILLHPLPIGINNDPQRFFLIDKHLQLLMAVIQVLILPVDDAM